MIIHESTPEIPPAVAEAIGVQGWPGGGSGRHDMGVHGWGMVRFLPPPRQGLMSRGDRAAAAVGMTWGFIAHPCHSEHRPTVAARSHLPVCGRCEESPMISAESHRRFLPPSLRRLASRGDRAATAVGMTPNTHVIPNTAPPLPLVSTCPSHRRCEESPLNRHESTSEILCAQDRLTLSQASSCAQVDRRPCMQMRTHRQIPLHDDHTACDADVALVHTLGEL